jgi:hypothetical protein
VHNREVEFSDSSDDELPVRAAKAKTSTKSAPANTRSKGTGVEDPSLAPEMSKLTVVKGKGKSSMNETRSKSDILIQESGDLYLWHVDEERFNLVEGDVQVTITEVGGQQFNCAHSYL